MENQQNARKFTVLTKNARFFGILIFCIAVVAVFLRFKTFFCFCNSEILKPRDIAIDAKLDSLSAISRALKTTGDSLVHEVEIRDVKIQNLQNEIEKFKVVRNGVRVMAMDVADSIVVSDVQFWSNRHMFHHSANSRDMDVAR